MSTPTLHIFEDIFAYFDGITTKFFTDGATNIASSLQGTARTLLLIYMALWGWSMMRGMIQEPVMDGVARMLKATFIVTFALSSTLYASDVASFLYNWPSELAGVINGNGSSTSALQIIDQTISSGLDLAVKAWQVASMTNLGAYFVAILLFVVSVVITALTAAAIISAKIALTVALTLGPLFIFLMIFEKTQQFFDRWLNTCITSGLTITVTSVTAQLIFKYFDATFQAAGADAATAQGVVSLTGIAPAMVFGVIAAFFLKDIAHFVHGLGGGVSGASSAAAGWAYNKIAGSTPTALRMGKAGYGAGKAAYGKLSGAGGRFGRGQATGGSVQGSKPLSVYRKITSPRQRKAA